MECQYLETLRLHNKLQQVMPPVLIVSALGIDLESHSELPQSKELSFDKDGVPWNKERSNKAN